MTPTAQHPPDPPTGQTAAATPTAQLDHLVVLASDLAQGVAWCEQLLGVTPQVGGKHPLMGTHNRLLNIGSAAFPHAYLELIAIDPEARNAASAGTSRWFDMDSEALQAEVAAHGPKLIHFVARVPRIDPAMAALATLGIDRGAVLDASRATTAGLLQWRIGVRRDGARLFDGALPTLIEWGAVHPAATMAGSGVKLTGFGVRHPEMDALAHAYQAIGLDAAVPIQAGTARLTAQLDTPRGSVQLCSVRPCS